MRDTYQKERRFASLWVEFGDGNEKKGCTQIKMRVITLVLKPDLADTAISAKEGCEILREE